MSVDTKCKRNMCITRHWSFANNTYIETDFCSRSVLLYLKRPTRLRQQYHYEYHYLKSAIKCRFTVVIVATILHNSVVLLSKKSVLLILAEFYFMVDSESIAIWKLHFIFFANFCLFYPIKTEIWQFSKCS